MTSYVNGDYVTYFDIFGIEYIKINLAQTLHQIHTECSQMIQ